MYNILICDDQPDIVNALKIYLSMGDYRLFEAYTGRQAVELVQKEEIHLILMDIMMPEMDGIAATQRIREFSNAPIILLTAKSENEDKVLGLNVGADDYITKPFVPMEVLARVRSQLRRYTLLGGQAPEKPSVLTIGGICLDDEAKTVTVDGEPANLTPMEFSILRLLMSNPGKVYSSRSLYEAVWNEAPLGSEGAVAVHIRHLREKIEINPSEPRYLKVVWGQGYKMEGGKTLMYNKRYSLALKTGCFLLLLVALVTGVAGGVAACYLADQGAYTLSRDDLLEQGLQERCSNIADNVARAYAQEASGVPEEELPSYLFQYSYNGHWQLYPEYYSGKSNYRYEIRDASGKLLKTTYQGEEYLASQTNTVLVDSILIAEPQSTGSLDETVPQQQEDSNTVLEAFDDSTFWYRKTVDLTYSVTGYVLKDMAYDDTFSQYVTLVGAMYQYRFVLVVLVCVCLAALLCLTVYLLSAAGRRPDQEGIFLNPLDRVPGDLYLVILGASLTGLFALFNQSFYWSGWITLVTGVGCLIVGGILVMAALLSLATRVKYGNGYWWRHSVTGFCLLMLGRGFLYLFRGLCSVFRMLPVIWKWVLTGAIAAVVTLACLNPVTSGVGMLIVLGMWTFLIVYPAWSLGKLQEAARHMAQGKLQEKLDPTHLHGSFRQIAQDLNALGQGASLAVERQLKSERMKTELITNVSHDIKTPLTSIVNYVDLLQKPHTPAEGEQYLEVLARQSQRLKKLTEDLVEMSKASSGSIPVNLAPVNVVELVNQALAEYEEKLQRANLPVVLTAPQPEILVSADGRLFWRVMDNLLGNCVKYAQPGTRVYVDVVKYEKKVMISVKNISQAELNLPAEELMERFVRGDSARNTEGSGLGLNIAKTLMSLQKGKLNLVIDGDLFKAVLLFNCLSPTPEEKAP